MYDKQLDSGRGTLLHLCDDVIQQEVSKISLNTLNPSLATNSCLNKLFSSPKGHNYPFRVLGSNISFFTSEAKSCVTGIK